MHKILSIVLLPFSILYGIGVSIHQALYHSGILRSVHFSFPVISIGNLSVGGTGKSPHIEFLIQMLKDYIEVGVLSRGYKRRTQGYRIVETSDTALEAGDEPLQIKQKFPEIPVVVSENRAQGIPRMLRDFPQLQTILLDDAFQHLAVKPALQILLTEFANPYSADQLLPSGRLREWKFGAERADVIVVSKSPEGLGPSDFMLWRSKLKLRAHQELFFSRIEYGEPYSVFEPEKIFRINPGLQILLISAIAQSSYLVDYLSDKVASVINYNFEDHHYFNETELSGMLAAYEGISHTNKMILTTEKDATRLHLLKEYFTSKNLELYAIPIRIVFYEPERFESYMRTFLLDFKV